MIDAPSERSQRLCKLYARFREHLDAMPRAHGPIRYNWWNRAASRDAFWMPYSLQLDEYARELTNVVNRLSHQILQLRAWAYLIEPSINLKNIIPACHAWSAFAGFSKSVSIISTEDFGNATVAFRNSYQHRFPRRLVFGHTSKFVTATKADRMEFTFGEDRPFQLIELCQILDEEMRRCRRAYAAFRGLVSEQLKAIGKAEKTV
jgi:hypothetical protein